MSSLAGPTGGSISGMFLEADNPRLSWCRPLLCCIPSNIWAIGPVRLLMSSGSSCVGLLPKDTGGGGSLDGGVTQMYRCSSVCPGTNSDQKLQCHNGKKDLQTRGYVLFLSRKNATWYSATNHVAKCFRRAATLHRAVMTEGISAKCLSKVQKCLMFLVSCFSFLELAKAMWSSL